MLRAFRARTAFTIAAAGAAIVLGARFVPGWRRPACVVTAGRRRRPGLGAPPRVRNESPPGLIYTQ
jgi:hypothetical protein